MGKVLRGNMEHKVESKRGGPVVVRRCGALCGTCSKAATTVVALYRSSGHRFQVFRMYVTGRTNFNGGRIDEREHEFGKLLIASAESIVRTTIRSSG